MTTNESLLTQVLDNMELDVYDVNKANGWFDEERTVGDDIALMHSEISEMLEAFRRWGNQDVTKNDGYPYTPTDSTTGKEILPKPEGIGSEAADVLIRLLDFTYRHGIELGEQFIRKLEYNKTRGYKHGGKRI